MDPRIQLLLRLIQENKGTVQFSSKAASKLVGLGDMYFLRLFSLEMGRTFRRHLRDVRMSHAAELVRDSLMPVKTIAAGCGYTDVSNFYRDFKQVHGVTPMRMRLTKMATQFQSHDVLNADRTLT